MRPIRDDGPELSVNNVDADFLADVAARADGWRGTVAGRRCVSRTWVEQATGAIRGEIEIEGSRHVVTWRASNRGARAVNIEPGCANTLAHTLAHTLAEEFPELDRPTIGRVVFSLAAYLYALPQGTALGPVVEILAIASDILADEADGERTVSCIST